IPRFGNAISVQSQRFPSQRIAVEIIVQRILGPTLWNNGKRVVETESEDLLLQRAESACDRLRSFLFPTHFSLPSSRAHPIGLPRGLVRPRTDSPATLYHNLTARLPNVSGSGLLQVAYYRVSQGRAV